jgi:hypothetical protein
MGKSRYTPHVSPELAKNITQLQFTHYDIDDLATCIQPFRTACRTNQQMAEVHQFINIYDDMVQGAGAQLTDIVALKQVDKVNLPRTMLKAVWCLISFCILLHAILAAHTHW